LKALFGGFEAAKPALTRNTQASDFALSTAFDSAFPSLRFRWIDLIPSSILGTRTADFWKPVR